mmetsp:Transcript_10411/g.23774  ORF Transcript_10411/g.23774 Transcript_10411/m.23774 type:complete len:210 (+) Transcript_10411:823-1452(+)
MPGIGQFAEFVHLVVLDHSDVDMVDFVEQIPMALVHSAHRVEYPLSKSWQFPSKYVFALEIKHLPRLGMSLECASAISTSFFLAHRCQFGFGNRAYHRNVFRAQKLLQSNNLCPLRGGYVHGPARLRILSHVLPLPIVHRQRPLASPGGDDHAFVVAGRVVPQQMLPEHEHLPRVLFTLDALARSIDQERHRLDVLAGIYQQGCGGMVR